MARVCFSAFCCWAAQCAVVLAHVVLTAKLPAVCAVLPPAQLRLDAKLPGTVLLRDKNGGVFYITIDNVQQVSSNWCSCRNVVVGLAPVQLLVHGFQGGTAYLPGQLTWATIHCLCSLGTGSTAVLQHPGAVQQQLQCHTSCRVSEAL